MQGISGEADIELSAELEEASCETKRWAYNETKGALCEAKNKFSAKLKVSPSWG